MKRLVLSVICSAVIGAFAYADDGPGNFVAGGAVKLMGSHPTVRMVSEVVRVKLPECTVSAKFVFRNEGPATTVVMAFPEQGTGSAAFEYFHSYVDGKPVSAKRVRGAQDERNRESFEYWWTKSVPFAKGQTRVVENRYKSDPGEPEEGYGFGYTLATGASWKGSIGRATVICDIRGLSAVSVDNAIPSGYKREGDQIRWEFRDFEPTIEHDINVWWTGGFWDVFVNGRKAKADTGEYPSGVIGFWCERNWPVFAKRRGDDVYAPVRGTAAWLRAKVGTASGKDSVRLTRLNKWVEVTPGSRVLKTSSGDVTLREAPTVRDGCTVCAFKPIVAALGGKARFDQRTGRMYVTIQRAPAPQRKLRPSGTEPTGEEKVPERGRG